MSLSTTSIKNPVFAWMLMLGLILFGWISFKRMGISQLPDVDFPVVSIQVNYEGAAPEVIESDIVDVVENSVMTVQGIRSVVSYARYGVATVSVELDLSRDIDAALQEIQGKLAQAQRQLPKEMDPPVVTKTNPEDQPIMWLTISSDKHSKKDLMRYVRDSIKDQFSTVNGVGDVILGGYVDPNLRVWISNPSLNRYELAVGDVLDAIRNEHSELPAGQIETTKKEFDVRTMGEATSIDEFGKIVINSRGGRPNYKPIHLKDVARIEEGLGEVRRVSRFNKIPAVGLGIRKQRGSNAVAVSHAVRDKMASLQKQLPAGMTVGMNFDTTRFIEDSVGELNFTLILSAVLTGIVCWLFLGSWSATVNVLMAIPTSIIGAFIVLSFAGFTLNTFTLLGLSLAIGIVVDDAIMVLENIVRHREMKKSRMDSALDGAREITFAAMAATVAIIAIFLPVVFMRGVIGKFFFQFGVTMTVTVALSLLEALTLTPMRCSKFVEPSHRTTKLGKWIESSLQWNQKFYHSLLTRLIEHPFKVLVGSLIVFAVSIVSVKALNKEFVPAQDQGIFIIRIQTAPDSSLAFTDNQIKILENYLSSRPEVERMFANVGGFGGGEVNSGMTFVTLKGKKNRGIEPTLKHIPSQQELMDIYRKDLKGLFGKGIRVSMQDLSMRGFTASRGFPVEFSLRGSNWEEMAKLSQTLMAELEKTGLMTDLDSDYKLGKNEVRIIPDRDRAALRGVSVRSISETISTLVGGVITGKYPMGGHRYDIRARLEADERERPDQVNKLFVRNNRGELVRLGDVVRIEERPSLQQIARYDRERAISIFANMKPGASQAAALDAVTAVSKRVLPEGYRVVLSGSAQTMGESFKDLLFALIIGIVVAYMVLGSQFNSFVDPITVLMALPFSLSGAFVALWLTHQSINIYSFIGLILLMGIVKKNSILLVEFTHQVRESDPNLTVKQALLKACPIRLRPILMTSTATIAGAIPPALAVGPGAETRIPMAIAVIGGVIVSTVLTLLVIPCVYLLFARLQTYLAKFKKQDQYADNSAANVSHALIIVICFATSIYSQNSFAEPLRLDIQSAIEMALQKNTDLQVTQQKINQKSADYSAAKSGHWPTLSLNGLSSYKKDAASSGGGSFGGEPYNAYNVELKGVLPIYRGGGIASNIESADFDRKIAETDLESQRRDLMLSVFQSFHSILLNQKRLDSLRHEKKLEQELLNATQRRKNIGRSQLIDVLQIQTQAALLEPKLLEAQNSMESASAELATLLGLNSVSQIELMGDLKEMKWREISGQLKKKSENSRILSVEKAELTRNQLSEKKTTSLAKHLPTLDLTGLWGRYSNTKVDLLDDHATAWNLSFVLSIPLFSGYSSFSERESFASQNIQLEKAEISARDNASLAQVKTLKTLESLEASLRATEDAMKLAQDTLVEANKNYRLATIDLSQLLTSERAALDAELMLDQARFDYIIATVKYFLASGWSIEPLIQTSQTGSKS